MGEAGPRNRVLWKLLPPLPPKLCWHKPSRPTCCSLCSEHMGCGVCMITDSAVAPLKEPWQSITVLPSTLHCVQPLSLGWDEFAGGFVPPPNGCTPLCGHSTVDSHFLSAATRGSSAPPLLTDPAMPVGEPKAAANVGVSKTGWGGERTRTGKVVGGVDLAAMVHEITYLHLCKLPHSLCLLGRAPAAELVEAHRGVYG